MSYRPLRSILVLTILFLAALPSFAADPTADLLGATHVKHFIRLNSRTDDGKQVVVAVPDSFVDAELLPVEGTTFATNGKINVLVADFNPLTQVWTVKGTTSTDPNYAAIKQFLDDLKPLQDTFVQKDKEKEQFKSTFGFKTMANVPTNTNEQDACRKLRELLDVANARLISKPFKADDLTAAVEGAHGFEGVKKAAKKLTKASETLRAENTAARDALNAIRDEFATQSGKPPKQRCPAISSDVLVDYIDITGKAERVIADREALAKSLDDLVKDSLTPYNVETRWAGNGGSKTDLVFTTLTPTFDNQISVDTSVKAKKVELSDKTINVTTADSGTSAAFMVRRDSAWVPERAAAVIYNHLTYPTYGTDTDKTTGKTTVQRTADTQPVGGAIMLNLITHLGGTSAVYPMLQIGVSSAKEFPGLLFGAGVRFTAPVAFSLSAGGMVTRYKDLDKSLKVGDEVTGTDEINKHLQYKTSPVVPYVAIQMKF